MKKKLLAVLLALFLVACALYAAYSLGLFENAPDDPVGDTYVDFIDCGQGDSILIVSEGQSVLIDATTGKNEDDVTEHLQKRGITKIDHFVLTHSHEDHIGGADAVLDQFEVGAVYMKKPPVGKEPTTKVYLNLLKQIKSLGKKVTSTETGMTFECGSVKFEVLGPLKDYEETNDQSVILRGTVGDVSFLFTGDQEIAAEEDLVARFGSKLDSTVLKVGHHGSEGSSSKEFLEQVSPEYAVIQCGEDNSYGHPHREALERLEDFDVQCYRTDLSGTVAITTDGKKITVTEEK